MENEKNNPLHIMFLPLMAQGHIIPTIDIAKLFASKGLQVSIVTTEGNSNSFVKTLERTKISHLPIAIISTKFPSKDVGLPEGCESLDAVMAMGTGKDLLFKFLMGTSILHKPVEEIIRDKKPHCLVADMFFPWTTEAAAKYGIPRLVFHGTCVFSLCVGECLRIHQPELAVSSDTEPFVIPDLPGDIKFSRSRLSTMEKTDPQSEVHRFLNVCKESWVKCSGVIVNSFYELEPQYAAFYREVLKGNTWHIGPVSLCNRAADEKVQRGKQSSISEHDCMTWLASKERGSVVYVCFGSSALLSCAQTRELAAGLEAAGQNFIWVVGHATCKEEEEWLPRGFTERTMDRGLVIRGWAPQVLILDHDAVGGFVTHCGWNSVLEGITAGVAMVTWPIFADQFYNEKLVTEVLKIGVPVSEKQCGDVVKAEEVERAVRRIMVGEEALEMGDRVKKLAEMAHRAVQVGGSSFRDFEALVNVLKLKKI